MALYLASSKACVFPDLTIVCGPQQIRKRQGIDCLENPTIVIEVLSPSTASSDHGRKLHAYTKVKSIRQYLIISSQEPLVTRYSRNSLYEIRHAESFSSPDQSLFLTPSPASLTLAQIHSRIQFDQPNS
jgi:Uma2 family endonuclease